jgi:hypothetical protein
MTKLITPLAQKSNSYIDSTKGFLNFINSSKGLEKNKNFKDYYLVTADVSNMFSCIPVDEAIDVLISVIERNRHILPESTPHQRILRMFLKFILKDNYFQFMNKYYLQILGIAMGCKLSPAFANIFMDEIERNMTSKYSWYIDLWRRYIDDIFFIWKSTLPRLKRFIEHCNSFHPNLKYTFEYSKKEINFLDVNIKKSNKGFETSVYKKPTHKNAYVHYTSNHPLHMFRNIIYNQVLRLKMINSNGQVLHKQIKELQTNFLRRGYPHRLIINTIHRAIQIPRTALLAPKKKTTRTKQIRCNVMHSIYSKYFRNRIRKIWRQNIHTPCLQKIWPNGLQFIGSNAPNLQKYIVRAKLK